MTGSSSAGASTEVSRVIAAPRDVVYGALLDRAAVAAWQHPDSMRCQVHAFDAREGGFFRISLTYEQPADGPGGKTTEDTDTYHGRFVRLVPNAEIEQAVEFESRQAEFAGEMRITVRLADASGGTEVVYRCDNLPSGVRPADNVAGSESALGRLARLLEGRLADAPSGGAVDERTSPS